MTSKERIKKTLEFKIPDKVGIFDDFTDDVIERWRSEGKLPRDVAAQEYFDFDINIFGFDQRFKLDSKNPIFLERIKNPSIGESPDRDYDKAHKKDKYLVLSCIEPFEHIAGMVGRENLLAMMSEDKKKAKSLFVKSSEFTLNMCQLLLDKGYHFDGAWLWGDLGHKDGLMFSTDFYNYFLFGLHKEYCDFFRRNDMPVIFHSDGNIEEVIPYLIKAGVRAIEPLESDVGMNLAELKKEYGKDIVFFGGIDERSFANAKQAEDEIRSKFKYLMECGGYIYHADSPIVDDISFEDYTTVIELVKRYGVY